MSFGPIREPDASAPSYADTERLYRIGSTAFEPGQEVVVDSILRASRGMPMILEGRCWIKNFEGIGPYGTILWTVRDEKGTEMKVDFRLVRKK